VLVIWVSLLNNIFSSGKNFLRVVDMSKDPHLKTRECAKYLLAAPKETRLIYPLIFAMGTRIRALILYDKEKGFLSLLPY